MKNIFDNIPNTSIKDELFSELLSNPNIKIERIVSTGQVTPKDEPYCQQHDEWVMILNGEAQIHIEGKENFKMSEGDYIFIPKNTKHWVTYTSITPPTVWLAIHIY